MKGFTVWFTGLPCSGKSTISERVFDELFARGYAVELIDGDVIRQTLTKDLGFSREDRDANVERVGFVAEMLCKHGIIVLVSLVSPYRAARDQVRARIGSFLEVWVDAPLSVCEERDVKGLYRRARAGGYKRMTGVDDPYERPVNPELICFTNSETVAQSTAKVLTLIEQRIAVDSTSAADSRAIQKENGASHALQIR